jgi:hypothetical protein
MRIDNRVAVGRFMKLSIWGAARWMGGSDLSI